MLCIARQVSRRGWKGPSPGREVPACSQAPVLAAQASGGPQGQQQTANGWEFIFDLRERETEWLDVNKVRNPTDCPH